MDRDQNFPYEYGSDLHWLWGWGARLKDLLSDDTYEPDRLDWMIFRPDRQARDAMTRFSVYYPLVMKSVDTPLGSVERMYKTFCENPADEDIADSYVRALDVLEHRIAVAAETIAADEKRTLNEKSQPEPQTRGL